MLRIQIDTVSHCATLRLEGRLTGLWVDELARCWASVSAGKDVHSIRVDLDGLTFIGSAGKALLQRIHEDGAVLFARHCMTRAIIDEITRREPA